MHTLHTNQLYELPTEAVEDFDTRLARVLQIQPPSKATQDEPTTTAPTTTIGEDHLRLLEPICKHEGKGYPCKWFTKAAKMSPRKAKAIRAELVDLGLIVLRRVCLNGTGRSSILMEPTAQGRQVVKDAAAREETQ